MLAPRCSRWQWSDSSCPRWRSGAAAAPAGRSGPRRTRHSRDRPPPRRGRRRRGRSAVAVSGPSAGWPGSARRTPGPPRAAVHGDRRSSAPTRTAAAGPPARNCPRASAGGRGSTGSRCRSAHRPGRAAAPPSSTCSAGCRRPPAGSSASGWRRRVSVNRRCSTSASQSTKSSRTSQIAAPPQRLEQQGQRIPPRSPGCGCRSRTCQRPVLDALALDQCRDHVRAAGCRPPRGPDPTKLFQRRRDAGGRRGR